MNRRVLMGMLPTLFVMQPAMACPDHHQSHDNQTARSSVEHYQKKAVELYQALKQGNAANEDVMQQAHKLMEQSKRILADVMVQAPQCGEYLGATLSAASKMLDMAPSDIEKQYHQDQGLPKAIPECNHAKDLLVHPATVYALAKASKNQWQQVASKEMHEVVEHAESVVAQLH